MIGFNFNGKHSSTLNIGVKSTDRTLRPAKIRSATPIPGRHGSWGKADDIYENRQIRMVLGLINNKDWSDLRDNAREVAEWLDGSGKLIFDDEPEKYYMATVYDTMGIEQLHLQPVGGTEITFDCLPFAFMLDDINRDDTWLGADYPWRTPIAWQNEANYSFKATGAINFTFDNPGSQLLDFKAPYGAKSLITITGSWTTIGIAMNGKTLTYNKAGTGTITINNVDMDIRVAGLNGLANLGGDIDSFLPIKKGSNTIRITGTGLNVNVGLDFKPMWI